MDADDIVYGRESFGPCKVIGGGNFEPGLDRQIDICGYSPISAGSGAYGLRWIESGLKPGLIFFDRKVPPNLDMTWRTTSFERKENRDMNTSNRKFNDIDEYIRSFPPDVRKILEQLRKTIREVAPDAEEAISYGMPTFKLNGNLVHFAAFKHHIGFYPTASGVSAFEKELVPYTHSKGAVQFPIDKPIPLDLVREIAKYRVKENTGDGKKKK